MTDVYSTVSSTSQARSPRTIAVDNFLRKALRVGDPHDPAQVAAALMQRYPEEAERVRREREGLPYSTLPAAIPLAASGVAGLAELAQAQDDLARDSQALIACAQIKDIRTELTGWARTIRRVADDGLAAARLSLDSVQHNRALAARSLLGSYARLARYVGTLTDGATGIFRRFAQSCDSLAGLILVAMGEGLAANGITRSTALVRVAAGELQSRRNAVIIALRSLSGSVDTSLSQEEWPRGMEAYRLLIQRLDSSGQADLRALLEESALSQAMDELVDLSAGGNVGGLRELSTVSALLIHRFQRLIQYGRSIALPANAGTTAVSPESPPLVAFTSALQLFVDAFQGTAGSRLLYVARPPIVVYGLYGAAGPDEGAVRLMDLTVLRGTLAEQIDCFAGCECEVDALRCQILADFLLFAVDRAIDAYAVGTATDGRGDPEGRAAAFGLLIKAATEMRDPLDRLVCPFSGDLSQVLARASTLLLERFGPPFSRRVKRLMIQELRMAYHAEGQTERLVRALSPSCHAEELFSQVPVQDDQAESLVRGLIRATLAALNGDLDLADRIEMPPTIASSLASIAGDRSIFISD